MADEGTLTIAASSTLAGGEFSTGQLSGSWTIAGLNVVGGTTQNVATTDEQVVFTAEVGDIPDFIVIENQGIDSTGAATTKDVVLSYDTGGSFSAYAFARIPAGASAALFPTAPTGKTKIYAEAESGATNGVQIRKWASVA